MDYHPDIVLPNVLPLRIVLMIQYDGGPLPKGAVAVIYIIPSFTLRSPLAKQL